jgi:hypothetical protein
MTEQMQPGPDEPEDTQPENDSPARTGVPSVDAVLSEIDDLDELPVDQHLATFERAHDTLRSALDATTDPAPDEPA